jgi:hypothetical protein
MKTILTFCWLLLASLGLSAQQTNIVAIDLQKIRTQLKTAPTESSAGATSSKVLLSLPLPDGAEGQFRVVESPMLDPVFAAQRPDLKTYAVQSVDDPGVTGRFALSDFGLSAVLLTPAGMVNIQPVDLMNPLHHKVVLGDQTPEPHECPVKEQPSAKAGGMVGAGAAESNGTGNGTTRRTYRMAIVCTGEFYKGNGNNAAAAQTAVVNSMNAIQAIYDRDLAVRFTVLTPFIYPDFNTDPFNPGLDRTQAAADAVALHFAQNTYDIGHVFHDSDESNQDLGGGGIAGLGVVCNNNPSGAGFFKGLGWSGSFNNTSVSWFGLLAHEMGHQFGAGHSFNGNGSNCDAAIWDNNAYEIASGTTIMSYRGICGPGQNIPGSGAADNYFHARSLEQMLAHINGEGTCAQNTPTGNTPPVINANPCGGTHTIPRSTPFTLTGAGVDPNGDAIQYTWEQYQEDGPGTPTQGLIGAAAGANPNAPLFRSYPPSSSPSRNFPPLPNVIAGTVNDFEALPSVGRTLLFRLTGRDNNPNGGGMHCSDLSITVSGTAGPFAVTSPNGGENLAAGGNVNITWDNAGTTTFCNNVNIRLSTDGGNSYPILLAANVPNATGNWTGNLPAGVTATTTARVKVECADNTCVVFYDISNGNFSVTSGCQAAASFICPDAAATFQAGAAGLNLGLTNGFGTNATALNYNVTTASPMYGIVTANQGGNACQGQNFQNHYGVVQFSVDKTGTYTFNKNFPNDGFTIINLYQNSFNPASPCTNWLASSAQVLAGGSISGGDALTAALTECGTYFIVASRAFTVGGLSGTVSMNGPGSLKAVGNPPPAGFGYTYAAVNTATSNIAAVSANSDFTTLAAGNYQVYGISFDNAANPANFVGQSIAAVYASGACALFSGNAKSVNVTPAGGANCNLAAAGLADILCNNNNTPNNPADDYFTFKLNPTGTGLSANGYTVNGATLTPTAAAYGAATTFARPAGTLGTSLNLTIQDNGSAACQLAVTVASPAPAIAMGTLTNPTNCQAPNGAAVVSGLANGQQYNLSYKLNGTAANAGPLTADANGQITLPNLAAGTYTELFTLPTAGGCTGGPLSFTLANAGAPVYTVAGTNPTTCGGTDGNFTISGLTANTAYDVAYTANGNAVAPASLTANANGEIVVGNLSAGNFTNITAGLGGCTGTPANVTLANSNVPVYTLTATNPTTNGGSDGAITLGNAMPFEVYTFTYKIVGGPTWSGTTFSNGNGEIVFDGLGAAEYINIIVTLNGCASAAMSATLTNPPQNFFLDEDNDGFPSGTSITAETAPPGYKSAAQLIDTLIDCNDLNPDEFPGQIWWQDLDGDGCGDGTFFTQCAQPPFCNTAHDMLVTVGDCNDNDPNNAPLNVPEICNGQDDDCDGEVDEGGVTATFFKDADGDGFGDPSQSVQACPAPAGYVSNDFDCDDTNSSIKPFIQETCNLVDDNCNGLIDEGANTFVGNLTLTSQAQVNAFLPCYRRIEGNLTISGSGMVNLLALSNLEEVTGNVTIQNTRLKNLNGLNGLKTIGGSLAIKANNAVEKLSSLDGLESLSYVGKDLQVYFNFKLTDCCAILDLINTPGAVGTMGGGVAIYLNRTGCDNVQQVNDECAPSNNLIAPATDGCIGCGTLADGPVSMFLTPNPSSGLVSIRLDGLEEDGAYMAIFDQLGRLVYRADLEGTGFINLEVDLTEQAPGEYFVRLVSSKANLVKKLVLK